MVDHDGAVRTCIGCRTRGARHELVRFVLAHGDDGCVRVVQDHGARLPGRGAWLHEDGKCKEQAMRRRAFQRALRVTGNTELRLPGFGTDDHVGDGHVTSPSEQESVEDR